MLLLGALEIVHLDGRMTKGDNYMSFNDELVNGTSKLCTCKEGIADVIQKLASLGVYGDQIALITKLDRTCTEHVDTWQEWWLDWLIAAGITREQELTAIYNEVGLLSAKACNVRLYEVVSEYDGPILIEKEVDIVQVSKLVSMTKTDLYKDIVSKLNALYKHCVNEGIIALSESSDQSVALQLELRQDMWRVMDSVYATTTLEIKVTDDTSIQSAAHHI